MASLTGTFAAARLLVGADSQYAIRLARSEADVQTAQALRFEVFNLELGEGLAHSFATGRDSDPFDAVCDHLLVEHTPTNEVVGTYRLQTGRMAGRNRGYYSEQEFDFAPFAAVRGEVIELGRACVHKNHRNLNVLGLLWKGIADYARERGGRYLCGCSSLTSQDPREGASVYSEICRKHLALPAFRTKPMPGYECSLAHLAENMPKVPKLLRAYLSVGARICGPPALDREFKTIDFLTLVDLQQLPISTKSKFFG
jgi:putative hemolysin